MNRTIVKLQGLRLVYGKREYDRYKEEIKRIVNTVARIRSEQVRVRRVRERLSRVHALIYPGVAPQGGDATAVGMPLRWGCTTVGMTGIVPPSGDTT